MIVSKNRISKDEINSLPLIEFNGRIILVDSDVKSKEAYSYLKREIILGIDTETRPAFNKGESHPVSLIQISTENDVYIFQLKYSGFSDVKKILESKTISKIGISLRDDFKDLKKSYGEFKPNNFIDISQMASRKGIIQIGVRALSSRYLERRISKSMQVSNWGKKELSEKQLKYAATDAWICLQIYPRLIKDKTDYYKLKLLEEELMNSNRKKNP